MIDRITVSNSEPCHLTNVFIDLGLKYKVLVCSSIHKENR